MKHDDPYKTARIKTFESQKNEELDVLKCLKEKEKKFKKRKTKDFDSQVEDAVKSKKIKTMIDFDNDCNSIK